MKVIHYVDLGIPTEGDVERAKKVRAQQNDYYFRDAALFDPKAMERCDAVYAASDKRGEAILSAYEEAGVPKHDLRTSGSDEPKDKREAQEPAPGDDEKQTDEHPLGPDSDTPKDAVRPRGRHVAKRDVPKGGTGTKESS